jgi:hypothetical protein
VMLLNRNCTLGLEFYFRPEALGNERPRQPVHGKAEVVKFPQVDIGADRARLEGGKQLIALRLQNNKIANEVESLVPCGGLPAVLRRTALGINDGIEGILPSPGRDPRICARQICLGDLKIQVRLADGLIAGVEQGGCLGAISRAGAFLLSGFGVFDVEHAAAFAAVEDVTTFHSFRLSVRSYETERGFGCISYTKRAAYPVVASDCRVLPE